jgi:uncharacterized integral membrane protein
MNRRSLRLLDDVTVRLAATAIALVLLVIFVAQNFVVVEVRLLFWRIDLRLAWALVIIGVCGALVGSTLTLIWRSRRARL